MVKGLKHNLVNISPDLTLHCSVYSGMDETLVRSLIAEHLAVPPEQVTPGALFRQDLGADSLDMIQLAMLIETKLGIIVDDQEAESCLTVGDAVRLLRIQYAGADA
jgi:acyl carrier protein